jgi:GTPase-associated system-like protein
MTNDVLQGFLNKKLFDIGPEDERLVKLRSAAADLGTLLIATPSLAVNYSLVAFDPEVSPDDPVLTQVAQIVEKHWNTYLSCFSDRQPRNLWRAVLLDALRQASEKDGRISASMSLLGRNILPHLPIGVESGIWEDVIQAAEHRAEELGQTEWTIDFNPQLSGVSLQKSKESTNPEIKLDRSGLASKLGPAFNQGSFPFQQHIFNSWAQEAANRASAAIADSIDASLEQVRNQIGAAGKAVAAAIEPLIVGFTAALQEATAEVSRAATGLKRRTELIWWREALYSAAADQSYRAFCPETAALLMAIDLHAQVPPFCPLSVEYFLRETILTSIASGETTKPKDGHLQQVAQVAMKHCPSNVVADRLASLKQKEGRRTLVSFLADTNLSSADAFARFRTDVGVSGETVVTVPQFGIWIFRELQAMRVTADKKGKK